MSDSEQKLWIVFNGEIYNFQEIRNELVYSGCAFASHTDTEVILQAYQRWGLDCLPRFNGMFAFALYDQPRRRLFRFRLGEQSAAAVDRRGNRHPFAEPLSGLRLSAPRPEHFPRGSEAAAGAGARSRSL